MPDKLPPDTALGWPKAIERYANPALVDGLREAEQEHAAAEAAAPRPPTQNDTFNFHSGYSDRPYEVAVDMWQNYSAVRRADAAREALRQARNAVWADVHAKLCSAELCVWGQEDPVARHYQRLPAELWVSGLARLQGSERVVVRTTPPRVFYNIRVAPTSRPLESPAPATSALRYRQCSPAQLDRALRAAKAEKGCALTQREAEQIGAGLGASQRQARAAWAKLHPEREGRRGPHSKSPRNPA